MKKEILEWIRIFVVAIVAALFCNHVLIVNATVPSSSMEDTIHPGDRLVGFRLSYHFAEPKRGDIIIFRYPDDESQVFIKRIIGLPGESVQVTGGQVYIDGNLLDETDSYVKGIPTGDFGPYEVPEDSYFVMGDNRNNSLDSRFWNNHFVSMDKILAKAVFQYFPRIRKIE